MLSWPKAKEVIIKAVKTNPKNKNDFFIKKPH